MMAVPKAIELTATLVGFLNIYLATRANIWNWFFGVIAVSLYFVVFLMAKLYANAGLQVIYLIFQFYGFLQWREQENKLKSIAFMPLAAYLQAFFALIILDLSLSYFLSQFTDSNTVMLDALNTSLCLIAQWMMVRKWPENWWCWSVANMIALIMYFNKSLYFMTILHVVFLVLNFYGYSQWSAMASRERTPSRSSHCQG
jgi:nicotinamide mononucleotide transporter